MAHECEINCNVFTEVYWYHPDYLGNTEYVSDIGGFVYQHFYYFPFGEALVSQHANSGRYDTEFRFNGKEQDPETGLYYYGARYYNPRYSIWMSVDPLYYHPNQVDKSPYAYTWNNPVNLVDPDGRCPDCPDASTANEGDIANPHGQQEYVFANGEWTGVGGEVDGGTVTPSGNRADPPSEGSSGAESSSSRAQTKHEATMSNPVVQHMHKNNSKIISHTIGYPVDFMAGVYDFMRAYREMRQANWVGSDKYFHAKANFNASRRGPGGSRAATHLSNLREILDQRIKGDSRQDSREDQEANLYGRNMGWQHRYNSNADPRTILRRYRPHNLPNRY